MFGEEYVVTRNDIAKYQLCKQMTVQQLLLGNSSVDTLFPPATGEHWIMEETFSAQSVPGVGRAGWLLQLREVRSW
jgi:hypothetical protein